MQAESAVYTTNLEILRFFREKFDSEPPFYFAMDLASLGNLLENKKIEFVFINSTDFDDTIREFLHGEEIFYKIFTDFSELEEIIESKRIFQSKHSDDASSNFKNSETGKVKSKSFSKIIGNSRAINEVRRKIIKAAETDFPVLITGETGSGKTLVANAIHELSSRSKNAILEVNLNEISPSLFESALFGHEKGSFTGAENFHRGFFEEAAATTLFLDEIGDLPPALQTKLLRAIDKREFFPIGSSRAKKTNARLIFATNANLPKKIFKGEFRQDLYRRLKNLVIEIPPLRSRKDDIPFLAENYMKNHGNGKYLSENSLKFLQSCNWPENIGQLENCLNRAIVFSDNIEISPEDIEF